MGCQAILTKVSNEQQTRARLPAWTSEDPNEIISDVKKGKERVITTQDCDECKADLERGEAAVVRIA